MRRTGNSTSSIVEIEAAFRLNVRDVSREWPRTQTSRAASQSGLLVEMKAGVLVGLKQPILTPRVVRLVVGDRGAVVRGERLSGCDDEARVRGVAMTSGSRREAKKGRGYIFLEDRQEMLNVEDRHLQKHGKDDKFQLPCFMCA